ncbi:hypothetical protein ACHAXT_011504 [Thalassiosira profunda]
MERYHALVCVAAMCLALSTVPSSGAFAPLVLSHSALADLAHHRRRQSSQLSISSGFSFSDGEQILVSLQKPMGIVLEQADGPIIVTDVSQDGSADGAGVRVGDVLLAVQNASVENADLDEVLAFIANAPRVVNLRFLRKG